MADEIASPAPPSPPNPSPPPVPPVGSTTPSTTWANFTFTNLPIGLAVFFLASIAVIFLSILINLPIAGEYFETKAVRSLQIVLAVAGLGLIANFLTSSTGAMSVAFGLLVVAALIVPSKDIVRFALILSGSDRRVDEFYGVAVSGANAAGRSSDAAQNVWTKACRILNEANPDELPVLVEVDSDTPRDVSENEVSPIVVQESQQSSVCDQIDESIREDIINEIASAIEAERRKTMIERIKARGAVELLEAIGSETTEDFMLRHEGNERLAEDLRFLRQEDLVSIAYDNVNTAKLTPFGLQVLSELFDTGRSGSTIGGFAGGGISGGGGLAAEGPVFVSSEIGVCPADDASYSAVNLAELSAGKRVRVDGSGFSFLLLSLKKEDAGAYQFRTERLSRDTDPTLYVGTKSGPVTPGSAFVNCITLAFNDDAETGGLDSVLQVDLAEGTYVLAVGSIRGVGEVRLIGSRVQTEAQ